MVRSNCRLKTEIADVKLKKAENQSHLAEINKIIQEKAMVNQDKQDDLQLIVDDNSQLKVHLAKNKFIETRLQEEIEKLEETKSKIGAEISITRKSIENSGKVLEETQNARTEVLGRLKKADETLIDWNKNFADREAKELRRRERVSKVDFQSSNSSRRNWFSIEETPKKQSKTGIITKKSCKTDSKDPNRMLKS